MRAAARHSRRVARSPACRRQRLSFGRSRRAFATDDEGLRGLRAAARAPQPLAGVYLSFFLMVTLLILVSSTWMGLYLAKRITRPVQLLSVAAREIGQGRYDQRIEHEATDEFGSMIEAFNTMAAELASSRRRLERAAVDLERKNQEVDGRRRYIETILERVATGVVSIDPAGRIGTVNSPRCACSKSTPTCRPAGRGCLRPRRSRSRSTPCSIRLRAPDPTRLRRKSRSFATAASCTSRPRPRGSPAPPATTRARCWCSTMSRR